MYPIDSNGSDGPNFAQEVSARIRQACLRRGWDVAELVQRAGISRATLYHLEQGTTSRPRVSTLCKVAAALEIPAERLLGPSAAESSFRNGETIRIDDREKQRRFDRVTNTSIDSVRNECPELFVDWDATEWDELYSEFGTGGQLSREGVIVAAQRMNQKRETIQQLHIILETHLHDVATNIIDSLYRMVQPPLDVATTPQLAALLEADRLQSTVQPNM